MKRKNLSKKIRFEVFKRDSFTCQYCGSKSPEVVLEVDHIKPISKGGDNSLLNLVTSCFDCNRGKSNIELNDDSVVEKQRKQLEQLQERKEQIQAMFEWHKSLVDHNDYELELIMDYIDEKMIGRTINRDSKGAKTIKSSLKKYGMKHLMESIDSSADSYLELDNDEHTSESANEFIKKISAICYTKSSSCEYTKDMYYIRGIIKNRFSYYNPRVAIELIKKSINNGYSFESMKEVALEERNWSNWKQEMEHYSEAE